MIKNLIFTLFDRFFLRHFAAPATPSEEAFFAHNQAREAA